MTTSKLSAGTFFWIVVPLPKIESSGRRPGLGENLMNLVLEKH